MNINHFVASSVLLVMLFSCEKGSPSGSSTGTIDGHDYVDLGLSVKWATCNLGASTPNEVGDFYAWAYVTPHTEWTEANYNFNFAPCNTDFVLDAKYDAITVNWGKSWRMPTKEEIDELLDNNKCDWRWIDNYNGTGSQGYQIVSRINGNSIFLPAGHRDLTKAAGKYWSSTGDPSVFKRPYNQSPWTIFFKEGIHYEAADKCYNGLSIRGVVGSPNYYFPEESSIDDDETQKQGFTVNGKIGAHTFVDLGLPSKTLWATYNVGGSMPYEYGEYYAWGETAPKDLYDEETYKFFLGHSESGPYHFAQYSKYIWDSRHGNPDYILTLQAEDDAATVNWGAQWRMPSKEQGEELAYYCKWYRKDLTVNGEKVIGFIGESKLNGNKIYIPFSDFKYAQVPVDHMAAWYWTCDLSGDPDNYATTDDYRAYCMAIKTQDNLMEVFDTRRVQGLPVRPVVNK